MTTTLRERLAGIFKNKVFLSEAVTFAIKQLPVHRQGKRTTGGHYLRMSKSLIDSVGDLKVGEYTTRMIQTWYDLQISRGIKPRTANTYRNQLSGMFNHLVNMGHIKVNPCNGVTLVKTYRPVLPKKVVSAEEIESMIESTDSIRNRAILWIAYDSGARGKEIREMKLSNLKIVRYYMRGKKPVMLEKGETAPDGYDVMMAGSCAAAIPKGKPTFVKFKHQACVALLKYLRVRPKAPGVDSLFLSSRLNEMSEFAYAHVFRTAASRVGVEKFTPKMTRDAKAYRMRKNNWPMQARQDALGHQSIVTTINYYSQFDQIDQLEEFLSYDDCPNISENVDDFEL